VTDLAALRNRLVDLAGGRSIAEQVGGVPGRRLFLDDCAVFVWQARATRRAASALRSVASRSEDWSAFPEQGEPRCAGVRSVNAITQRQRRWAERSLCTAE
jgi:hypothetical protein